MTSRSAARRKRDSVIAREGRGAPAQSGPPADAHAREAVSEGPRRPSPRSTAAPSASSTWCTTDTDCSVASASTREHLVHGTSAGPKGSWSRFCVRVDGARGGQLASGAGGRSRARCTYCAGANSPGRDWKNGPSRASHRWRLLLADCGHRGPRAGRLPLTDSQLHCGRCRAWMSHSASECR